MRRALVLVRNTVSHDSRVLREARVLRDLGFDVLVAGVVSQQERETELDIDGIRVVRLLGPLQLLRRLMRRGSIAGSVTAANETIPAARTTREGRLRRLLVTLAFNAQGAALAWRTSPALVHANDYDTMWIGLAAKLLRRSRVVYDAHELWPDRNGRPEWRPRLIATESLFVRLADAMTTVSPGCAEVMARRYRIPPPVVVRNVPERPTRHEAPRPHDPPVAVYVGVLAPGRGIEQAVEALAAVPNLRLRLIGPASQGFATQVAQHAEARGVANRVETRPPVDPDRVPAAIADAAMGLVLIQPTSLSHRLSLPNKLFEYVVAGLPVVASDLPVMGPLVRDEGIGEVVPPADVDALAAAMQRLADPARNSAARERVRSLGERVNWQQERRVLEDVYRGALERRPATAAS
ncbi:MAG TPA: glycosyltransferase [Gaiellaceae bacterium]|nr:glycosyltransferase [Gaiellaceae bacterium]